MILFFFYLKFFLKLIGAVISDTLIIVDFLRSYQFSLLNQLKNIKQTIQYRKIFVYIHNIMLKTTYLSQN